MGNETLKVDMLTKLDTTVGLLVLLQLKGVGPATAMSLATKFKAVEEVIDGAKGVDVLSLEDALAKANKIIKECIKFDIRIISIFDKEYPFFLRGMPQPAPLIYVKGKLKENNKYIACVGTREPTEVGVKTAKFATSYFAKKGWSIVSGLAIGVDTLCHEEALRSGGHTVAILANGLDTVAPKSNSELAQEILDNGGALVSEYPPGTPVYPRNLVIRDRLQSGFSVATIPMQTGIKGGTLHTINFSFLQNRCVVVPVHVKIDEKSEGLKYLLDLSKKQDSSGKTDSIFPEFKKDLLIPLRSEDIEGVEKMLSERHLMSLSNEKKAEAHQMKLL